MVEERDARRRPGDPAPAVCAGGARRRASPSAAGQSLVALIERQSEEGGDFDTDI
jgi:hypothetical protein